MENCAQSHQAGNDLKKAEQVEKEFAGDLGCALHAIHSGAIGLNLVRVADEDRESYETEDSQNTKHGRDQRSL